MVVQTCEAPSPSPAKAWVRGMGFIMDRLEYINLTWFASLVFCFLRHACN
jgi:hypothetical protein